MAHDDEHHSQVGSWRDAPEAGGGITATAHAINIALAELQSEWFSPEQSSRPDDETSPEWPAGPTTPAAAEAATEPTSVDPEPPPAPPLPPSEPVEPPKPIVEPAASGEPERRSLPRDRIYPVPLPTRTPTPARHSKAAKFAVSVVVPLLFGMVGAWAYEQLFTGSHSPDVPPDGPHAASATDRSLADPEMPPKPDKVVALKVRVDRLADRLDVLAKGLDAVLKPEPAPDMAAIRRRLDELDRSVGEFKPLARRIDRIDERLAALDKSLKGVPKETKEGQRKIDSPTGPGPAALAVSAASSSEAEGRDISGPVLLDVFGEDEMLEKGVDFFKRAKYKEAVDIFRSMEQINPDDARVWYFAALSRGLVSGQWDGETGRLAEKGVERERSGTPDASQIDAAFRELTQATGKDWLAYYRNRAGPGK